MSSRIETRKSRLVIFASLILIVSLGCLCMPAGLNLVSTPEAVSTTTETPQPSPSATPQAVSPEKPSDGTVLNTSGPWLLIETEQGLWAANPDGSALTQLTTVDYWKGGLKQAIQPKGNQVVFLSPGNFDFNHMALNLLSLPDGKVTRITNLTSTTTEDYAQLSPGDPGFEALRAVGEQTSYAWSPDGTRLAFGGVMDGPSADIYLYDVTSGTISRVSQDPAQNFAPSWSPDGTHLLYMAAESFGTGAGGTMSGVWMADSEGANPTELFATNSAGEEVEGWLDDSTVLLATWAQPCGLQRLRFYDLNTHKETVLNEDCFNSASAAHVGIGSALYSNASGIYMLTTDERTPTQVSTAGDAFIDPRQAGDQVFTVRFEGGGMATFGNISDFDHQVSPVKAQPNEMDLAEYGAIWGWTSLDASQPGAWITGPGVEFGQIFDAPASHPIWSEHNNLLFFAGQDSGSQAIYLTTFDNFYQDLHQVNTIDAQPIEVAWLGGE